MLEICSSNYAELYTSGQQHLILDILRAMSAKESCWLHLSWKRGRKELHSVAWAAYISYRCIAFITKLDRSGREKNSCMVMQVSDSNAGESFIWYNKCTGLCQCSGPTARGSHNRTTTGKVACLTLMWGATWDPTMGWQMPATGTLAFLQWFSTWWSLFFFSIVPHLGNDN